MTVYNKPLFYIGAIFIFAGTYLDYSHHANDTVVYSLLVVGFILALVAFKKPKE